MASRGKIQRPEHDAGALGVSSELAGRAREHARLPCCQADQAGSLMETGFHNPSDKRHCGLLSQL